MMNDFSLYCAAMFLGEIIFILPFILLSPQRQYRYIILLFAILLGDIIVTVSPVHLSLHIGHWNWIGKTLALLFSIILIYVLKLSPNAVGLRLPQTARQWRDTALGIMVLMVYMSVIVFISGDPSSPNPLENWLFEATLPGIDEELFFRGVAIVVTSQAFPQLRFNIPQWVAPFTITTGMFALFHLFSISHGHVSFNWLSTLAGVLPISIGLYVIRYRTGSVFSGMVAHNMANLTNFFLTTS